ncbi:hypothetical protein SY83_11610 [Paenibacillus swuensis]|uniref:Stage II sporulation protein M n=1 Tax=Paenibacillus swuensis TaxID=1178515 RepID=A0A172TIF2_9BACL|nr:stage II sporulation protein M [Paenibacillus swuensis]ANE46821.1 hypothetical protein SY83_11610 [Paenibacillus swuensis]
MTSLRIFKEQLRSIKRWLAIALLLFIAGAVMGATMNVFQDYGQSQTAGIKELAEQINAQEHARFILFVFIFLNNAIKSVIVMFTGLLFGIIPTIFLFINGLVMGYIFGMAADQGADVGRLFLRGILPHGIIELPVMIVSGAIGLNLGALMWKRMWNWRGINRSDKKKSVRAYLRDLVPVAWILVALLLIAAVIESTITFWLLER